jgi:hypothetical protein
MPPSLAETIFGPQATAVAKSTRLAKLLIQEVSGVDDPANEIPGWMIMKNATSQPTKTAAQILWIKGGGYALTFPNCPTIRVAKGNEVTQVRKDALDPTWKSAIEQGAGVGSSNEHPTNTRPQPASPPFPRPATESRTALFRRADPSCAPKGLRFFGKAI